MRQTYPIFEQYKRRGYEWLSTHRVALAVSLKGIYPGHDREIILKTRATYTLNKNNSARSWLPEENTITTIYSFNVVTHAVTPINYGNPDPTGSWEMEFARRLKYAMKVAGLTRYELADKIGVSRHTVERYTKGEAFPNCKILRKLSQVLDCEVSYLIDFDYILKD